MGAYVSHLSYRPLLNAKQLASSLPGADPLRERKTGPAFDDPVENRAAGFPFEFSRAICSPRISALVAITDWMLSSGSVNRTRYARSFLVLLYRPSLAWQVKRRRLRQCR